MSNHIAPPVTKAVEGNFGKTIQITRSDFAKRWTDHVSSTYSLADTVADYEALKAMVAQVEEMAGRQWDRMK